MSRCYYNSKILKPTPFVTFQKNYRSSPDGQKLGSDWEITVIGTIVVHLGSPDSSGTLYSSMPTPEQNIPDNAHLESIFRKQEGIRELFSENNKCLEFQSENASQPISCYPVVNSIVFENDLWYNICKYTVSLTATVLYANGTVYEDDFTSYITEASDTWSIETEDTPSSVDELKTYRMSHSVSATGQRHFDVDGNLDGDAYEQARRFVLPRLGMNSNFINSSGVTNLPSYFTGFNHSRSENVDVLGGNYSVAETWILSSGNFLEDFNIETSTSIDSPLKTVAINGTITGLSTRNANMQLTGHPYAAASGRFNTVSSLLLTKAQDYAGINLNITPVSTSVSRNLAVGTIGFNYTFNDRPSNIIPGSLSEVISINDSLGTNVIAEIGVLFRNIGPILQDVQTSNARSRTLSLEVVMNTLPSGDISSLLNSDPSLTGPSAAIIDSLITAINPANAFSASQSYLTDNQKTYLPKEGRVSINKSWTYEI